MDRANSSSTVGSALRKVESFQYPAAHLNHLSETQVKALESFKDRAASKGYFKPATGGNEASHDDETLLRYLRARKFAPEEAFKQFKDTEDWRRNEKIDELYDTINIHEYDETRRLYPQWTGRRDRRGIPLYVFEVSHLTSKLMATYEKSISNTTTPGKTSPKLIRLFALYENLLRFALPLCSEIPDRPYPETPVSQSSNVVDISGVGLKQFWNLRQHMQDASQLATAHYPETLDRIFVIGAPSFFPTVWSWIKGWFDPITVSKIFILSKENMEKTLRTYIDPSNIPVKYGGTLEWQWGSLPALEPAIDKVLIWEKADTTAAGGNAFPIGPVKWVKDSSGNMVAHAVGSENGKPRNTKIAVLPMQTGHQLSIHMSRLSTNDTNLGVPGDLADEFGPPSTSGTYTHPGPEQKYFPQSGTTPPDESEADENLGAEAATTGAVVDGPYQPPTRQGTSATRYAEQSETLAHGQMYSHTPDMSDPGTGDKTTIMEPSTVGQALKNVDIPEASSSAGIQRQPGYLEQATTAASGAASAVGGIGTTVLAKVGLGGAQENKEGPVSFTSAETKAEDPRIDNMEDKVVEDFIRGQHTSHNKIADRSVD